jgi:hypothetical protein
MQKMLSESGSIFFVRRIPENAICLSCQKSYTVLKLAHAP